MANPKPIAGRCNAHRRDGQFCGNRPHLADELGGNGRCKFHGGLELLKSEMKKIATHGQPPGITPVHNVEAKQRHGLYAASLQGLFRKARHQAVFCDPDTAKLDLTPEIRLWRTKILKWEEDRLKGHSLILTDNDKYADLDEVIWKATHILERLIRTQKTLHPEADASGELTVRIVVDAATQKAATDMDMPDLEASSTVEEVIKSEEEAEEANSTLHGSLDDFLGKDD